MGKFRDMLTNVKLNTALAGLGIAGMGGLTGCSKISNPLEANPAQDKIDVLNKRYGLKGDQEFRGSNSAHVFLTDKQVANLKEAEYACGLEFRAATSISDEQERRNVRYLSDHILYQYRNSLEIPEVVFNQATPQDIERAVSPQAGDFLKRGAGACRGK